MLKLGLIFCIFVVWFFSISILDFSFSIMDFASSIDKTKIILSTLIINISYDIISYKRYKQDITLQEKKIKNFTIEELDQRNELISEKKEKLNIEKTKIESAISNLKKKIEQYKLEVSSLQEDIDLISSLRDEYVNKLCTEILDEQFEIEQSNPSFQKVIKTNNK